LILFESAHASNVSQCLLSNIGINRLEFLNEGSGLSLAVLLSDLWADMPLLDEFALGQHII